LNSDFWGKLLREFFRDNFEKFGKKFGSGDESIEECEEF
jgi:hypothetical protein